MKTNTSKSSLDGIRIEYHILQSFPVTCLNRDDVGAPKTAMIGGSTRARVSSQCWKRQVRLALRDQGVITGTRTKLIKGLVAAGCVKLGADEETALRCGEKIERIFIKGEAASTKNDVDKENDGAEVEGSGSEKTDTLLFLSPSEVARIALAFKEVGFNHERLILQKKQEKQAKELVAILGKAPSPAIDGLDIALFGRMVAQAAELNIEAQRVFPTRYRRIASRTRSSSSLRSTTSRRSPDRPTWGALSSTRRPTTATSVWTSANYPRTSRDWRSRKRSRFLLKPSSPRCRPRGRRPNLAPVPGLMRRYS